MRRSALVILVMVGGVAACGGGSSPAGPSGDAGASPTSSDMVLAMVVVPSLGQFATGTVVELVRLDGTMLASGAVDAAGRAHLGVPVDTPGPMVLRVGRDGDRYLDERAKTDVTLELAKGEFALRAALPSLRGQVGVSPYTEMAVGLLEARPGGLAAASVADVTAANRAIEKLFRMSTQLFPRYANEPPPDGILTPPHVFATMPLMFEPTASSSTVPVCTRLPNGMEVCEVPQPSFQGALLPEHAHALAIAVLPYLASSRSNVVQLTHDLRDDISDGRFDLVKNGAYLPSVDPSFIAELLTGMGEAVVVDRMGVLRRAVDGSPYGTGPGTLAHARAFNHALMQKMTAISEQILRDVKGKTTAYSGYLDFALGTRSTDGPGLLSVIRTLLQVKADYANRFDDKTLSHLVEVMIDKYNNPTLVNTTPEAARNDLIGVLEKDLLDPPPCGDGMVRQIGGACLPGTDSGGSNGSGGQARCSTVQYKAPGKLNIIRLDPGNVTSAPSNCITDYHFMWGTDSLGPGTGSYDGSCEKARANFSTPRTACYCYTMREPAAGSALLEKEPLCYVGF